MIYISLESSVPEDLAQEFRSALEAKFGALAQRLYDKVIENLSGKVLAEKSGELKASIQQLTDVAGDPMTAIVGPEPASAKAWALEYGGRGDYPIFPTKAKVLSFFWDKVGQQVWFPAVNHPPSKEFAYLRSALAEVEATAVEEMRETAAEVLGG